MRAAGAAARRSFSIRPSRVCVGVCAQNGCVAHEKPVSSAF